MRNAFSAVIAFAVLLPACGGSPGAPVPAGQVNPGPGAAAPGGTVPPGTPPAPTDPGAGGGGGGGGGVPAPTVDGPAWFVQPGTGFSPAAVPVGATASTVVQVFNVSKKTPLTIASLSIEGVNQGDFTVDAASAAAALGSALPPGQSASVAIVVTFTPTASGARSASLVLASNAGTATVALDASGLPQQPVAAFPADPITFISGSSAPASITMTNAGGAPLVLDSIRFAGADAASFQQVAVNRGAGNCAAPVTLPPGASCLIGVWYVPGAVGPKSADLVVATNDPGHLAIDIPLTITAP
jgi:hypothetical protein